MISPNPSLGGDLAANVILCTIMKHSGRSLFIQIHGKIDEYAGSSTLTLRKSHNVTMNLSLFNKSTNYGTIFESYQGVGNIYIYKFCIQPAFTPRPILQHHTNQ